jgi:hypothetical protein
MKKAADDLRAHYDFDFAQMKPNRFASVTKTYKQKFVALDEDVAEVFDTSESVNAVLRSAIRAMRTAAKMPKARPSKRRAS